MASQDYILHPSLCCWSTYFFPKLKVMALNVNTCQTDRPQSRDMTAEEFLIISNLLLFIIR